MSKQHQNDQTTHSMNTVKMSLQNELGGHAEDQLTINHKQKQYNCTNYCKSHKSVEIRQHYE